MEESSMKERYSYYPRAGENERVESEEKLL